MSIRLLYLTREPHPSFRPDLAVLFGESLPIDGVKADLLALGKETGVIPWSQECKAYVFAESRGIRKFFQRFILAFRLFYLGKREEYDAIQVRDRIVSAGIGLLAARFNRLPFFYWMSLPFPEAWLDLGAGAVVSSSGRIKRIGWYLRGQIASWILYKVVLPHADHIFVQSEAMRTMLRARGIADNQMSAVPMGVAIPADLSQILVPVDSRLKERKVVVYLGALERSRHPELMVHAMRLVVSQEPTALLVLVGDSQNPGERAWLESEVELCGLKDHVVITGWLSSDEAKRYLRVAQVGLSPFPRSRVFEVASPTKVCEYLAYGVPVVANDQPDQAEVIQHTGGGICVPLTADDFASGILTLLRDDTLANEMGQRGRLRIAGLRSYDVLAKQLAHQYKNLLD